MAYAIRSRIYLSDTTHNEERKFGEATRYVRALVVCRGGHEIPALLTQHELQRAISRARRNSEDIPIQDGLWATIKGLFRRCV